MNNETEKAFANLRACCDESLAHTYQEAKRVRELIADAMDVLQAGLKAMRLKADNCDKAHACEAAMYDYVKQSNPYLPGLIVAEGFGASMNGPERELVLARMRGDRDALDKLLKEPQA